MANYTQFIFKDLQKIIFKKLSCITATHVRLRSLYPNLVGPSYVRKHVKIKINLTVDRYFLQFLVIFLLLQFRFIYFLKKYLEEAT